MVGLHRWLAVGKCLRASSRLPLHKHLHELIRQRLAYRASQLAEQMMGSGMKVRTRSLEVLFAALAQTTSPIASSVQGPSSEAFSSVLPKNPVSRSLDIHSGLISDTSTRFAVRLLLLARQSRQRRTHRMFKTLMALCLINGEIIIASLLFGVLVRDWQKRVQLGQQKEDEEDIGGQFDTPKHVRRSRAIYNTPFPAWSHLNYMCEYIDESISTCPPASSPDTDPESLMRYTASLQALANLAQLLDHRMLPIGGLAGLLQTMYKCPSGDVKVWVWEKKKRKGEGIEDDEELEAHAYFKNVLRRLAEWLPRPKKNTPSSSSTLRESAPAPLTLQTYNTLLHYSLVHARARWMADKILHHMLYVHEGMGSSVVTMNILENAAMRSRDKGINRQWVEGWKKRVNMCSKSHGGGSESDNRTRGTNEISSLTLELLDIAARYAQNPAELVKVDNDNYTLSMRIAYLISRGRPEVVVNALPALLPGICSLRTSFHNRTLNSTPTKEESAAQYDLAIHRAVAYGPVVLTSLLTALMKTGRTGLAEKVWKIMKKAEQLSWELYSQLPGKEDKILSPWCLGVEAYTIMIRVYGKEARKGAGYGHAYSRLDRGVDTGKHMVVGWGRDLQRGHNNKRRGGRKKISRVQLGRHMGMKIYRTALKEAAVLRFKFDRLCYELDKDECLRMRVVKGQLRVPRPDAQFFNAILDIVARRPGMKPRSRASWTRRKARSRLIAKRNKYVWEGKVMGLTEPDVRLKEVARDIRRCGFQVPLLVRRILVGRDDDIEGHERGDEGRVWLK